MPDAYMERILAVNLFNCLDFFVALLRDFGQWAPMKTRAPGYLFQKPLSLPTGAPPGLFRVRLLIPGPSLHFPASCVPPFAENGVDVSVGQRLERHGQRREARQAPSVAPPRFQGDR